eukprot:353072-Chlamydomonas_euryale.AAC.8
MHEDGRRRFSCGCIPLHLFARPLLHLPASSVCMPPPTFPASSVCMPPPAFWQPVVNAYGRVHSCQCGNQLLMRTMAAGLGVGQACEAALASCLIAGARVGSAGRS